MRYSPTALGLGWAVLQPLSLLLLYTLVFSIILKVKPPSGGDNGPFVLYLMCGFLPYMACSEGIQRSSVSLPEYRELLDKVGFPIEIIPAVGIASATLAEVIGLVVLVGLTAFFRVQLSAWLLLLPLFVLSRLMITLGLAWLVSVLNVFLKDLGQFLGLLLTAWMFLTPIFYPVDAMPNGLVWLLTVNPLYHVIAAYRAVVLNATSPLPMLPGLVLWMVGVPFFGFWFFRQTIERAKDFL